MPKKDEKILEANDLENKEPVESITEAEEPVETKEAVAFDTNDPKFLEMLQAIKEQAKEELKAEMKAEENSDPDAARYKRLQESEKIRSEKMVKIRLFQDGDKYKDDVFVGWNGKDYLIKRGVNVEVPVGVAEIVYRSEKQREAAALHTKGLQDSFMSKGGQL